MAGKRKLLILLGLLAVAWLLLRGGWAAPDDPEAILRDQYASTRLLDRHGRPLRALVGPGHTRTRLVPLEQVSPHLITATLTLEDKRFWQHPGLDPIAIVRAAGANLQRGRVVSGASTLTQQVAKWLRPQTSTGQGRRTLLVKAREALVALHLEARHDKREILRWYLNYAPYGGVVRGAEQAAQAWLGKPARDLTVAEAAWLAVLPRAPGRLDPARDPRAAVRDQRILLQKMHAAGHLDDAGLRAALDQPISVAVTERLQAAPHFAELVAARLRPLLDVQPTRVVTTLDAALQAELQALADRHLQTLQGRDVGNAAIVVIDNASGQIHAMVGSRDYGDHVHHGAVNGALAQRQPGSTLKAFTYATAFEQGVTPATLLLDEEATFATPQGAWRPRNYGHRTMGPVRARLALATSANLAAVRLLERIGVGTLRDKLAALGFQSLERDAEHYGLALTLGDGEVTLLELTTAFATLARGGRHLPSTWLQAVDFPPLTGQGQGMRVPVEAPVPRQVFTPQAAFLALDVLADPRARELAFGRGGALELPLPAAVKTGTSKGFRDNWTVGATPRWTVGVWVGNFDGRPMRDVSGVTGAGPLWRDVMLRVAGQDPPEAFAVPDGLERAVICPLSGQLATQRCEHQLDEWFPTGAQPGPCTAHVEARIDTRNGLLAGPTCPAAVTELRTFTHLPDHPAWSRRHLRPPPELVSPLCPGAEDALPVQRLRIESPADGTAYYLDSQLPAEVQQVGLFAHVPAGAEVQWRVDGQVVATGARAFWPLRRGVHRIEAQSGGAVDVVTIRVD